jgi:bacteriorhodopsin
MADADDLVIRTARYSLATQVVFTAILAATLFLPFDAADAAVFQISLLESIAQIVEFAYYLIAIYVFSGIRTWTRYIDWVISTPLMLTSTAAFLVYLREDDAALADVFLGSNLLPMMIILALNWTMLLCGFLSEVGATPYRAALLLLGMLAFLAQFLVLYDSFVRGSGALGFALFMFVYLVWGLYGVVATLPSYSQKNIAYNALDIVSKNFYGLFLFVYTLVVLQ